MHAIGRFGAPFLGRAHDQSSGGLLYVEKVAQRSSVSAFGLDSDTLQELKRHLGSNYHNEIFGDTKRIAIRAHSNREMLSDAHFCFGVCSVFPSSLPLI